MKRLGELRREVGQALAALGLDVDARAYDGWMDPAAAAAAVAAGGTTLLRAAPPLAETEAPEPKEPREPRWLLLGEGAELRIGPLRLAAPEEPSSATAARVRVETEAELCCDARRCDRKKSLASVWLELAPKGQRPARLLLGEALGGSEAEACAPLAPLASALARRLGVPLVGADAVAVEMTEAPAGLAALTLSRWSLRREGEVFVLRDHATRGPREAAAAESWLALVLAVAALGATYGAVTSAMAHGYQRLALLAVVAAVLAAGSYAMARIAAHSRAYRPRHAALLTLMRDRLVLGPWHRRNGAVSAEPEGRFGAAVRIGEIERLHAIAEGGLTSLRYETAHGPYEVGLLEDGELAERWIAVLGRLAAQVVHVEAGAASPAGARRARKGAAAAATLVLVAALGCQGARGVRPTPAPAPSLAAPAASAAPSAPAVEPAVSPPAAAGLELIEDDLPRALAEAAGAGKALFIEVWAPWCHTCLSMKSYVLPDPALLPLAARVVFAAIDGDRPESADFVDRYQVDVWPTLYVLDPRDRSVLGMWQGSASVEELRAFITDAVDARDAALEPAGALAALLEAKRAHAGGQFLVAARHYQRALERGGEGWGRRSEALYGLLFSEYKQGHWGRCAQIGSAHVAQVIGAAVPSDYASVLMSCAERVTDPALRQQALGAARERLERHCAAPPAGASVDDRSDALALYASALGQAGEGAQARAAIERQLGLLEEAAARAPAPEAAAPFDYARMNAYLALGRGAEAVAMLRERVAQLPDGYEPWARLAQALTALGREREALGPAAKAVELSYGPRRLRYLELQARIFQSLDDRGAERQALEALVQSYLGLDARQKRHPAQREIVDRARARLRTLPTSSTSAAPGAGPG